jgi:hypothetical protein
LDYTEQGKSKANMTEYVKTMESFFPEVVESSNYPWNENLFEIDSKSPNLPKEKHELFHTFVAKVLFLCKRACPDIQPAIAF